MKTCKIDGCEESCASNAKQVLPWCSAHHREYVREWTRRQGPGYQRRMGRKSYQKRKVAEIRRTGQYAKDHPEWAAQKKKEHYQRHKEKVKAASKRYREENPEKIKEMRRNEP
jgi:hypothetical protein